MVLRLRDHLAFALIGDEGVLLDLQTERYFTVPADAARQLAEALADHPTSDVDGRAIQALRRRGWLTETAGRSRAHEPKPIPAIRQLDIGHGRIHPFLTLESVIERLRAKRDLRRLGVLSSLTNRLCAGSPASAGPTGSEANAAVKLARACESADALLGSHDQCLPSSLAFLRMCRRRRVPASIVFGVCSPPFAAHCWVQSGDTVINDSLERVAMFTPLIAV